MSQDDPTHDARTAPDTGASPDPAHRHRPAPSRPGGACAPLALLLALLAILGAGYVIWQQRQWQPLHAQALRDTAKLQAKVHGMERQLTSIVGQGNVLWQRFNDAEEARRAWGEQLALRDQRMRDVAEALGKLSAKVFSGQEAMLLDETEFLLRMGVERYRLFHDAQGAAQAFALASQTLAGVNDSAFKSVQQTIDAERQALVKSQMIDSQHMLDDLALLRTELSGLPGKSWEPAAQAGEGVWARIKRALHAIIQIKPDDDEPLRVADARVARELIGLDLAQAQAAWLAGDNEAASAALKRAQAGIVAQFDTQSPAVQQAQRRIGGWLTRLKSAEPAQPGAALTELRHLRAAHALKPNADSGASASETPP